ncbi:MAG: hypothetical protein ABSG83_05680 [Roseiarcus sp.]|jgi:hypothetical protein
MAMKFGLPVTIADAQGLACEDIINTYMTLSAAQKKAWLKAASVAGGCIRLSQPDDPQAIQINMYDQNSNTYAGCTWKDSDPF